MKMKDVKLVPPLNLRNLSLQVHLRLHLGKTTFRVDKNWKKAWCRMSSIWAQWPLP